MLIYTEDLAYENVKTVAQWKLKSTENILKSLLVNKMDTIAKDVALFYSERADKELLKYCLHNNNEIFLKYALRSQIFRVSYLNEDELINLILGIMEEGTKTEMLLNTLLFADFGRWE